MTQKRVTISTKISEEDFERIERMAGGISVSALVKILVMGFKEGEIEVKDGEIVREEPVEEFFHYEDTPLGVKIDRKFDKLRERGYPERVIDQMKENILNGIQSQIEMMPRRYDARRSRDYDCGA